jgi:lipopolysaccharide exporter
LGTSFLADVCLNVDTFVVSRFLGSSSLGLYTMARNVSTFPVRRMADVVKAVMYPAFAKVQDEADRIQRAYLKNLSYVGIVTFPILAGLAMVSKDFVPFVYGDRWSEAAVPLQMLCWAGLLRTITINFGTIYRVTGRPEIDLKLQIFRLVVLVVATLALLPLGLMGVALGLVISAVVVFVVGQTIVNGLTGLTYLDLWKELRPVIWGVAAIILSVGLFQYLVGFYEAPRFVRLFGSVGVGIAAYGSVLFGSQSTLAIEVWSLAFGTFKEMTERARLAHGPSPKEIP